MNCCRLFVGVVKDSFYGSLLIVSKIEDLTQMLELGFRSCHGAAPGVAGAANWRMCG